MAHTDPKGDHARRKQLARHAKQSALGIKDTDPATEKQRVYLHKLRDSSAAAALAERPSFDPEQPPNAGLVPTAGCCGHRRHRRASSVRVCLRARSFRLALADDAPSYASRMRRSPFRRLLTRLLDHGPTVACWPPRPYSGLRSVAVWTAMRRRIEFFRFPATCSTMLIRAERVTGGPCRFPGALASSRHV